MASPSPLSPGWSPSWQAALAAPKQSRPFAPRVHQNKQSCLLQAGCLGSQGRDSRIGNCSEMLCLITAKNHSTHLCSCSTLVPWGLLILPFLCPICKSGAVASPALSSLNFFLAGKRKKEICVGKKVGGGNFMVMSGLEACQGSQVKLKKSAVSQRMGDKGRGQRGRAECIQIKGFPKTFFFSLGPLFHYIQRAFISFPALFTPLASPH